MCRWGASARTARHTELMLRGDRGRGPRWSVRSRILAAILLVAAVGLGVTGTVTYLVQREGVLQEVDAELVRQVDAARSVVAESDADSPREALAAVLAVVLPPPDGASAGILGGRIALLPGTEVAFPLQDTGIVDRIVAEVADGSARRGTAVVDGDEIRYLGIPVSVGGDDGIFLVAIDVRLRLAPTDRGVTVFALVAGATLLAVALAGWLVAGRLLRPVRRLRETAERITATDLGERIPVDGGDDVSRLTETVNDMLDRLDAALRSQRDLLDDVRHELRTPLTVVRGHLELADPRDPDDIGRAVAVAVDELDRMSRLVGDLATFAETRTAPLDPAAIDIRQLTIDVQERARAIPGHPWLDGGAATGTASLDRRRIVQAWLQLADNAAKHSVPGGPIEIGSRAVDGVVELWVRDAGPGIPAAERGRIFERFTRVPGSPHRGSGLGLAIVDGIARAHGGSARAEGAGDGSRFVIAVPLGGAS